MLNFDRQVIAAAHTGSFENFEKALNLWEEFHGEDDIGAFFNLVGFVNPGIWDSLLPNDWAQQSHYPLCKDALIERTKKVKLILDRMLKRGIIHLEVLNNLPINTPDGKFYQRLINNQMTELLDHQLVKEEITIDMIRQYLLAGKTDKAIQKFKETKIDATRVFHSEFIHALTAFVPQASKIDKIYTDLHNENLLPLSVVRPLSSLPFNAANLSNYPKLAKTSLIATMTAIANLAKEEYADGIPSLVALRLIDQNLPGNETLATEVLSFLRDRWSAIPVLTTEQATDLEKIILALLNNGAEIIPIPGLVTYPFFQMILSNGMLKALAHQSVIEKFKAMTTAFQRPILSLAGKYDQAGVSPSQTDLEMMKVLCPYAKNHIFNVQEMMNIFNAWQTTPHDAASHERFLKIQGLLLEHGLVDGIEAVQPGSHTLMFNNHNTGMPYDLHAYLMDNPALQRGFRKPQRNEELLRLYALTKAILAQETRSPAELEKVRHYAGFRETNEKGEVVVYNRYDLKEKMQNTQKAVRASIMKWVDPARDIPVERRQVTAQKLENIALAHLPQEQAQPSQKSACKKTMQ